jgi:hypothetical protein
MHLHRLVMMCLAAVSVASMGCGKKPAYLQMEPQDHVFKQVGEEVWWRAIAKTRQGHVVPKIAPAWSTSDASVATVDAVGKVAQDTRWSPPSLRG